MPITGDRLLMVGQMDQELGKPQVISVGFFMQVELESINLVGRNWCPLLLTNKYRSLSDQECLSPLNYGEGIVYLVADSK